MPALTDTDGTEMTLQNESDRETSPSTAASIRIELDEKRRQLERLSRELDREIVERERAREAERALSRTLGERVKELDCLYGISKLAETQGLSLDEILQGTADIIPPAWQYPEDACARIILDGREYRTGNYRDSHWRLSASINVGGEASGAVEVAYLQAKPQSQEGPFLQEERHLIDAIAERLGNTVKRVRAESELLMAKGALEQQNEEVLEQKDLLDGLLQFSPLAVAISDLQYRITVVNPAFSRMFGYSEEESLGRDLDDILSTPETIEEMRAIARTSMVEQRGVNTVGKRKRKDASLVDVELFTTPFYVRGEQYGYPSSRRLRTPISRRIPPAT